MKRCKNVLTMVVVMFTTQTYENVEAEDKVPEKF